jgi:hypothetical protein
MGAAWQGQNLHVCGFYSLPFELGTRLPAAPLVSAQTALTPRWAYDRPMPSHASVPPSAEYKPPSPLCDGRDPMAPLGTGVLARFRHGVIKAGSAR